MISLFKTEKLLNKNDGDYISCELRGLSTDEKPTEVDGKIINNGSMFIEIDTGKLYLYDLESQEWKEI